MPKNLQAQIDEDARIAEWRAAEKKKAEELKINATSTESGEKPVKLRKDGTPMRKRGPKPKPKQESDAVLNGSPSVEKVIAKKARVPKKTAWQEREAKHAAELSVDGSLFFLREYFSDEFLEHCLTILKREKSTRKKASE